MYFIYFSILIVNCSRIRVTNLLLHDPEDVVLYYVVADPQIFSWILYWNENRPRQRPGQWLVLDAIHGTVQRCYK